MPEDKELIRRALMGDQEAQKQCSEAGIVLPCPICRESVAVHGPEDWKPTFHDPDSGGDPYWFECECGLAFGTSCYEFKQALALWNVRPAPPVGRCGECKSGSTLDDDRVVCDVSRNIMLKTDFCSLFEQGMMTCKH